MRKPRPYKTASKTPRRTAPQEVPPPHERYNRAHPLLRELVLVHVGGNDGESFDVLLSRVPGIGEEICREDRTYKVLRVIHDSVDDDGRARSGWHAIVDTELQPLDDLG